MLRSPVLAILILLPALCTPLSADPMPLTLRQIAGATGGLRLIDPQCWELRGGEALRLLAESDRRPPEGPLVLEFDYFCLGGVPRFAIHAGPPFEEGEACWSEPLGHREGWTPHRIRLTPPAGTPPPDGWRQLRLDLPLGETTTLRLRNPRLRAEIPGEYSAAPSTSADSTATLNTYLDANYPGRLSRVVLEAGEVRIEGTVGEQLDRLAVAEVPMERLRSDPGRFVSIHPVSPATDGRLSLTLPRHVERDGRRRDRLASRWVLVRDVPGGPIPLSHARYATEVACRAPDLPAARLRSKKGLGGWSTRRGVEGELEALGIAAVTVNVMVDSLVALDPGPHTFPIAWQGRTYHAVVPALEALDHDFREAAKQNAMVSAILLIGNHARHDSPKLRMLGHPDAVAEGIFAMPNVTSGEGLDFYGAALNLMAERWSRPDGQFGRVHHWIMHNEVDAGWSWTNCGEKELLPFVDLFHRSARLMDLIARQYDPHARVFVSLTHHWAETADRRFHPSRDILETLVRFGAAEGDFPWAIAYHPYPQSLHGPRTWEDDQAQDNFDSPKITPHNIQVLDRWVKTAPMLYRGTEVRPVHLSENGFNSPDYSEASLRDQAAGMAYAWKKIAALDSIEVWHYHNWIDNRHEGGLRIGLRKFPDDPDDPLGKKPIWHLYRALATPQEAAACTPYLDYIAAE